MKRSTNRAMGSCRSNIVKKIFKGFKGGLLALLLLVVTGYSQSSWGQAQPTSSNLGIFQSVTSINGVPVPDGGGIANAPVGSTVVFTATIQNNWNVGGIGQATLNTQVRELFSGPF